MAEIHSPIVSVIIPGYNHAPYLKARIDSVLAQDFTDFEVILLDDCSSDDSAEIMMSYNDVPKVSHVIINEENSGNTFRQWEKGISLAQGKYIWLAESDDLAEPTLLSTLVPRLEQEKAVMAFCHSWLIDSKGERMNGDPHSRSLYKGNGVYDGQQFVRERLSMTDLIYNASMVVWRKSCFSNVNSIFKTCRHAGDWLFWFEICRQGTVIEVPQRLNYFRQHPQKVTRNADATGEGFREIATVEEYILNELHATPYQRRVIRGRLTERLRREHTPEKVKDELPVQYPKLYGGNIIDILCYNIDKLFNISGFQYKKGLFN